MTERIDIILTAALTSVSNETQADVRLNSFRDYLRDHGLMVVRNDHGKEEMEADWVWLDDDPDCTASSIDELMSEISYEPFEIIEIGRGYSLPSQFVVVVATDDGTEIEVFDTKAEANQFLEDLRRGEEGSE